MNIKYIVVPFFSLWLLFACAGKEEAKHKTCDGELFLNPVPIREILDAERERGAYLCKGTMNYKIDVDINEKTNDEILDDQIRTAYFSDPYVAIRRKISAEVPLVYVYWFSSSKKRLTKYSIESELPLYKLKSDTVKYTKEDYYQFYDYLLNLVNSQLEKCEIPEDKIIKEVDDSGNGKLRKWKHKDFTIVLSMGIETEDFMGLRLSVFLHE